MQVKSRMRLGSQSTHNSRYRPIKFCPVQCKQAEVNLDLRHGIMEKLHAPDNFLHCLRNPILVGRNVRQDT